MFISCKDNVEKQHPGLSLPGGNHIEVKIYMLAKEDGNVKLFYGNDKDGEFSEENAVIKQIKGSNEIQRLKFNLPEGLKEPQLRLDADMVSGINLKKVRFIYGQRSIDVDGEQIFSFFRADINKCTVSLKTGEVKPLEGSRSISLYPQAEYMKQQLKMLTHSEK